MLKRIVDELKHHVPFTALGALSGILVMVIIVLTRMPSQVSQYAFYTLHPVHVLFGALVTTAMYRKHSKGKLWACILVGYCGSVGIATVSDAFAPYLGGLLLGVDMEFHVPFLETEKLPIFGVAEWQLVNAMSLAGIFIGYFKPTTKLPHTAHILVSTWATLLYFTAFGIASWLSLLLYVFIFLFLAVWVPCCTSDIVFPLLFIRKKVASPQNIPYNLPLKEE